MNIQEIVCDIGATVDWNAVASVATVAAVFVALFIPSLDRRRRDLADLRSEAAAAGAVSLSLTSAVTVFKRIPDHIRKTNGVMIDAPGNTIIYGVDACQEIIERDMFIQRLPNESLQLGLMVASMARRWVSEVNIRIQTQRNEELRNLIDWKNHEGTCREAEELHKMAERLQNECRTIVDRYDRRSSPIAYHLHALRRKKNDD